MNFLRALKCCILKVLTLLQLKFLMMNNFLFLMYLIDVVCTECLRLFIKRSILVIKKLLILRNLNSSLFLKFYLGLLIHLLNIAIPIISFLYYQLLIIVLILALTICLLIIIIYIHNLNYFADYYLLKL